MKSLEVLNKESVELIRRNNYLRRLIRKELFYESIKDINIDSELIAKEKEIYLKKQNVLTDKDYQLWLKNNNIDDEEIIEKVTDDLKARKFNKENFSHMVQSTFLKRKSDFEQVIYSLIRVNDFNLANELYFRIKDKEDNFGDLAKKFSLGPEKDSRGIVGPVFINQSHPNLRELIQTHKKDDLLPPFRIDSLWLIIRIETITEVTLNTEMEDFLQKELFENWIQEKSIEEMKKIYAKFNINAKAKSRRIYFK